MEMAKVTSKGQITIPVSIRKRLNIREGDKVLFLDTSDGVMMVNPDVRPSGVANDDRLDVAYLGHMDADQDDGFVSITGAGAVTASSGDGAGGAATGAGTGADHSTSAGSRAGTTVSARVRGADGSGNASGEHKPEPPPPERERPPLHENQYDVNKLLDEIRSFREKY